MDAITRLVVFTVSAVAILVVWGFVYTKLTGKPFIVVDKNGTKNSNPNANASRLNRQMSPLSIAGMAGVAAFGWIYYQYSDLKRGLLVSVIVFPVLYWIVWKGTKLEQNRKLKNASDE